MTKFYFILIVGMVFVISGCNRKKAIPDTMLTGKGVISADEALKPLMNAELDIFKSLYAYSSIDCKYGSEYDALNLLLQEKVRLAIVTRPLNQKEMDFFKSKEIVPESIPLAYDAVALIVHSENKTKALSLDQIKKILSGGITNWDKIDKSEKSGNIELLFDAESSGVIRFLDEKLNLNQKISGDIKFAGTSNDLIAMVSANPNAIGFVGYNWLSETDNLKVQQKLEKVNLLAVSNAVSADENNSFMPSLSSLYDNLYPLRRTVYAIYTDPAASLARGFLAHLTSERGQKIIYRCGLKPENDFQREIRIKKDY